jgi:AraC family transcriptional regulator
MSSRWSWADSRPHEMLHVYLEPNFVKKTAETCDLNYDQMAIEPQIAVRDEQLSHMAMSLLCELNAENIVGRLYADSVASAFAIQLIRRYSCLKDVGMAKGGMAPHKLRRALEYISDKLEQQSGIALDVVAQEVGMSRFHFSRVFKESMGLSPINYIVRQRIERAKKLLTETELPIADIALQAGFSGQSHFTTFFRKLVGLTPRDFRRAI